MTGSQTDQPQTTDQSATGDQTSARTGAAARPFLTRFRLWARSAGVGLKLEIGLAILAAASGVATYIGLSAKSGLGAANTGTVRTLLTINIILLLPLTFLIARRLVAIWLERRKGLAGSRLHLRLVGLFSLVAIVPPITMVILSALFLDFGLDRWFSETVRRTLNNSLEVASAYAEEHKQTIQLDLLAMATDLNRDASVLQRDNAVLAQYVEEQALFRALSEAIVFNRSGKILAKTSFNLDLTENKIPLDLMRRITDGGIQVATNTAGDRVEALTKLDNYIDTYLYVSRFVDARVLGHLEAARSAITDYEALEGQRSQIQIQFNLIFMIIALLILLAAVWLGLWFANRLATPIGRLVDVADRVREGDLSARVDGPGGLDEIGLLSRTFNRMTRQLEDQRRELVDAYEELDDRRRFLETVLEGVSAGVIGLSHDGEVTATNRSACQLLGITSESMSGLSLTYVLPEFSVLVEEAENSPDSTARAQVELSRDGLTRTLLVRVAAEQDLDALFGYVVTFDDVTDQLRDQRTAAWADVARRIAHEIKNPLTPIQLSAERLKRKYGAEITSDPAVFTQCTDTIIRQVSDLRRMVNEFSSFARMPAPVFRQEDLNDVVRQATFLQEVASPDVIFSVEVPEETIFMRCDGRLVAQALANLLKNASESVEARLEKDRHEEAGLRAGLIEVTLTHSQKATDITVIDNGLGLPDDANRLTEPYVTTRAKGTGLGLAIVKKVMEEHGGRLLLFDREEGGARVVLHFSHQGLLKRAKAFEETEEQAADAAE